MYADSKELFGLAVSIAIMAAGSPNVAAAANDAPGIDRFAPLDLSLLPTKPVLLDASAPEKSWDDFNDGWHYRSRPSLWAAGLKGTVGKDTRKIDVDESFSDLFDKLNIGLSMDFEVGKGPITFLFFGMWQQFETNASTKSGRFDADTKIELAIIDGALAYKFFDKSFSGADPLSSRLTLEILGGARWTYLSSDVDINGGPLGGTSNSRDADWIDPYVGLRGVYNFSQNFNISAMGTVGGFGVGSDLAWSAVAMVEYRITRRIGVFAGYKVISYDYDHNGFIWDVKLQGPVAGLSIRW